MKVQTLASGSKANCSIVLCNKVKLIIDAGISYISIKRNLEENSLSFDEFTGMLITHNHNDHIKGLRSIIKHTNITLYVTEKMYQSIKDIVPESRCQFIEDNFSIEDVDIELIHTSHDAPASVGYIITNQGKSLVYVTDTGYINRKYLSKMVHKDIYLIESNHDEIMLMDGPYPRFLKDRIISDIGHLSNKTTTKYLQKLIGPNTEYIVLAHLSETNNTKELAYNTLKEVIKDENIKILIADQDKPSDLIEV